MRGFGPSWSGKTCLSRHFALWLAYQRHCSLLDVHGTKNLLNILNDLRSLFPVRGIGLVVFNLHPIAGLDPLQGFVWYYDTQDDKSRSIFGEDLGKGKTEASSGPGDDCYWTADREVPFRQPSLLISPASLTCVSGNLFSPRPVIHINQIVHSTSLAIHSTSSTRLPTIATIATIPRFSMTFNRQRALVPIPDNRGE